MHKLYGALLKLFEWLLYILFAVLVVVVFFNVFSRAVLKNSLPWAEEMSRFLFVWITFVGSVLVNKTFGHMRLDLVVMTLPKKASIVLEIFVSLAATAVLFIMLYGGYSMMTENMDYRSPALEVPYGFINSIVPICSGIMFLQTIVRCGGLVKQLVKPETGGTK
jgi:TRAP-type C4-dicarboxylate transport system permease small subunit